MIWMLLLSCAPERSVICDPVGGAWGCPADALAFGGPDDDGDEDTEVDSADTDTGTASGWPAGTVAQLVGKDRFYDRIQLAIQDADDGDTVLVREGTHRERIDFEGKGIHVVSEAGPWRTILDATGLGGSVVQIRAMEPDTAMLQGFTITGGTGTEFHGGGVFVENADPIIQHNIVIGNSSGIGGGIYLRHGFATVRNNLVLANHAPEGGGGLTCTNCKGEIRYNTFVGNTSPNGSLGEWFYEPQGDLVGNVIVANASDPFLVRYMDPLGYTFDCIDNLVWPELPWVARSAPDWPECTGTVYADPSFNDPDNGDYSIEAGTTGADRGAFAGEFGVWPWSLSDDG